MFHRCREQSPDYRWLGLQRQEPCHIASRIEEYCLHNQALDPSTYGEPQASTRLLVIRPLTVITIGTLIAEFTCHMSTTSKDTRAKLRYFICLSFSVESHEVPAMQNGNVDYHCAAR